MKKIKVAHIMNSLGLGGVPVAVYNLLKALPQEKYELYLYCLRQKTDYKEIRAKQRAQFEKLGVKISFPEGGEADFQVVGDICRWLLRHRIDILHTHSYRPNIFARLAGVLCKKVKIVAHFHNHYSDKWERDQSDIYEKLLDPFSDRLIACSHAVRDHFLKSIGMPPEKISVVPNGVDMRRFQGQFLPEKVKKEFSIPLHCKVVGIVGRICEQKAQGDFIRAAAIIKQSVPDVAFLIVGQADDAHRMNHLQTLSKDLGLEKEIIFSGYHSDIPQVLNALDVFVLPSLWEGLPLILVEAMAAGTAIVASDIGPNLEVLTNETALFVPTASPTGIAEKVVDLLKNPEYAKQMAMRAQERAKLFSWEKSGQRLDHIYQEMMDLHS